jgi:hypothetical protein
MNATELATLSMSELKFFCSANSIEVTGDKRSKSTYILAIETFQSEQTVIETLPAIPDPFEPESIDLPLAEAAAEMAERSTTPLDLYVDSAVTASTSPIAESIVQQPTPKPQRQASIVALIPLILLSITVIAIRIGIGALLPLIAAVGQVSVSIWRSIPRTIDPNSIPLNYFPA